ncbi:redox-regulated ATPase YchF [Candidatus Bipolaricaulota bacterium]|nr:redox-regulated ATPase YchF [Candidatus Bipolaricaulota bacterium]
MALRCGLVGVPGCGKTTVFNALTAAGASVFDGAEMHRATVPVPDPRVKRLVALFGPKKIVPSTLDIVDIPGLEEGSTAEGGRGSRLLTHVKEADVLVHVVRCFAGPAGADPNPVHDVELLDLELMAADAHTVEKKMARLAKRVRAGDKDATREVADCERVLERLHEGIPARRQELTPQERASIFECTLVSLKPVLYVANVSHGQALDGAFVRSLDGPAKEDGAEVVAISGSDEAEISELPIEDRADFLHELGLGEPAAARVIHAAYRELGLVDFFTAGEREVHVWTCRAGDTAPVAAGKIHTEMEAGFIRLEVIPFEAMIEHGGEQQAIQAGARRLEGKDYPIQDGDVVIVRFSPPR